MTGQITTEDERYLEDLDQHLIKLAAAEAALQQEAEDMEVDAPNSNVPEASNTEPEEPLHQRRRKRKAANRFYAHLRAAQAANESESVDDDEDWSG